MPEIQLLDDDGFPSYGLVLVSDLRVDVKQGPIENAGLLGHTLDPGKTYLQMTMHERYHPIHTLHGVLVAKPPLKQTTATESLLEIKSPFESSEEEEAWVLPGRVDRRTPVYLTLFLARKNERGVPCAFAAGFATVDAASLAHEEATRVSFDFTNEHGSVVAGVSFVVQPDADAPVSFKRGNPEGAPKLEFLPRTVDRALLAETGASRVQASPPELGSMVTDTTPTFFGQVPKWVLALHTETAAQPTTSEYWAHAIEVACACIGVSSTDFLLDPVKHVEVLGQVVGIMAWQTPYLADGAWVQKQFKLCGASRAFPLCVPASGLTFLRPWLPSALCLTAVVPADQWRVARETPFWRSGDCEDAARCAHAAAFALLTLELNEKTPGTVRSLARLASYYCPVMTEGAIVDRRDRQKPFAIQGQNACLHLYFKLIPWTALVGARIPSDIKLRTDPDSHMADTQWGQDLPVPRCLLKPNVKLPVLVVEPTDHNLTAWNTTDDTKWSRALNSCVYPLHSAKRKGLPAHPWTHHVRYPYPPHLFVERGYYLYDILYYSKALYLLSGRKTPFWIAAREKRDKGSTYTFGIPPLGNGQTTALEADSVLLPAKSLTAAERESAERFLGWLPRLPPLAVPKGDLFYRLVEEINALSVASDLDTRHEHIVMRLYLRIGASQPPGHATEEVWSKAAVKLLRDAVEKQFRIVTHLRKPVVGSQEGLWIWLLAAKRV